MIQYQILEADRTDELQTAVNNAIFEGWLPAGGVFVVPYAQSKHDRDMGDYIDTDIWYGQAMTREYSLIDSISRIHKGDTSD